MIFLQGGACPWSRLGVSLVPAGRVPGAVGELGQGQPGRVSVENSAKIKKFGGVGGHFSKFP